MYPYFRIAYHYLKEQSKPKFINPFEETQITMRAWPWDVDMYMELNNGRYLTLMDIGRFAVGQRTNLFHILKANNWGLMVGAVSSRYRRRIKLFEKFTLSTKIIHFDNRWFYFHQQFLDNQGKVKASFLVRTAITSKNGLVPAEEFIEAMKFDKEEVYKLNKKSEWIEKWTESDEIHKKIMEG